MIKRDVLKSIFVVSVLFAALRVGATEMFPLGVAFTTAEKGQVDARYCPDNTCERLETNLSLAEAKAAFFIFLFSQSSYSYLDEWKAKKEASAQFHSLIAKSDLKCRSFADVKGQGKCALDNLAMSKKLNFFSIRFDEGKSISEPLQY